MFSDEHMNPYTILQRAQLLERFSLLQRRWFPSHKLQKHRATEAIDALMTEKQAGTMALGRWNQRARKLEGVTGAIDHDFHLVC